MKNFKQYYDLYLEFFDEIDGAVKHIDHLEENILNKGKAGVIEALENIDAAIEYFVGETDYSISTKFDGSPAIVAGRDPKGNFFVASKSAFTQKPKINYTHEDIDNNHPGPGLSDKLHYALDYLPSLGLKGIYQMDYMFDSSPVGDDDKKWSGKREMTPDIIDGIKNNNKFITFKPNTLIYAVSPDSPYGSDIRNAKIGVAIHIEYQVVKGILKVKKYTSSPSEFKSSKDVFVFNILINKPKNPNKRITTQLLRDVDKKKARIMKLVDKIDFDSLKAYTAELKTYINIEVRGGQFLEDTNISADKFITYVINRKKDAIKKLKREASIQNKQKQLQQHIKVLRALKPSVKKALDVTKILANLKNNLISIFNEFTKNEVLGTYLETDDGWKTTPPEGYAGSKVDDDGARITKFVDRAEFSRANFGTGKPGS
jgi:hypothetical protein|tara:strand:- start:1229 stop:2515 length:1287 start_codon:yes stop_codon:yes gene_type:complete